MNDKEEVIPEENNLCNDLMIISFMFKFARRGVIGLFVVFHCRAMSILDLSPNAVAH